MSLKVAASVAGAGAWPALWTCPAILISAFLVAWGAEAAEVLIGEGLALALLAWLQTLPEFGVEAVIAWHAGENPAQASLAVANLTGAIRLLIGLGWPLIYAVHAVAGRREGRSRFPVLALTRAQGAAVAALVPPLAYFVVILVKGTFNTLDAAVLSACYVGYLVFVMRSGVPDVHDPAVLPTVARWALGRPGWRRGARLGILCALGGGLLVVSAHPFFTSMLAVAALLGLAPFFVVQWLAPVLTEVPELVSAIAWARRVTPAPMALMNLVASGVNQWTVLAAMIPVVFGWAHWREFGAWSPFAFDPAQRFELTLALLQTGVGVALLGTLELGPWGAGGLLGTWIVQVAFPAARPAIAWAYGAWLAVLAIGWAGRRAVMPRTGPDDPRR